MADSTDRARKAFANWMNIHRAKVSGRSISTKGGLSPSAVQMFLNGSSRSPKQATFEAFARGASALLEREVTVEELIGGKPPLVEIPVRGYVGAGDEIIPFDDDDPIDHVPAPPGLENGEATEVRGRSMVPLYHDKDLLFHRRLEIDPLRYRDEVLVVQTAGGKRYVKMITPGTRKGFYTLLSFHPAYPPIADQKLDWVGPIEWVHKRKKV